MAEQVPSADPDRTAVREPSAESVTADVTAESTNPRLPDAPAGSPDVPGYRITGEIATGGMGKVYAAHHVALDREVAIKTLLPGANAERFVTESKITARLPHPGIPPVYDLGTLADGTPFLAMKLIRGKTLSALLKARPTPQHDLPRFVQVFEQIAQAAGFAHSRGVIHRDLKPLNVMVGEFGEVQVMDWGLARMLAPLTPGGKGVGGEGGVPLSPSGGREGEGEGETPDLTRTGAVMGTPGYMAPEQARAEPLDPRADVFALGAVLATVLTGKPAFVGTTARETVQQAAAADLADVFERLDKCGADAEVIALARRCLAADRESRPADGRAVAAEVAAYRAGVEARLRQAETERAEAVVREGEQRKRQRVLLWAAGITAAVLLAGVAGTTLGLLESQRQKGLAEANARDARDEAEAKEKARAEAVRQQAIAVTAEQATAEQLVKTLAAETEAKAALAVARERTKSLSDAYGDFVFGIQNKLQNRPGTQQLRKQLLEIARTGLKKILDDARKHGTADSTLVWTHFRMGDVELNLGNTTAARNEYQAGYELAKSLADADPMDAQAQRDLSLSFINLGDVTLRLGQTTDALGHYTRGRDIRQTMADADPTDARAQRDLGVSLNKLGDLTLQLGRPKDALGYFTKFNEIARKLADADPTIAVVQRDLGITFDRLGDVTLRLGQTTDALGHFTKYNEIAQKMADADLKDADAQRSLGVSFGKLGDVTWQLGRTKDALGHYMKYNEAAQKMAVADPTNADAQRSLGVSFDKLGEVTLRLGRPADALAHYTRGRDIRQTLADADPTDARAQSELGVGFGRLGDVTLQLGRTKDALGHYTKANEILQRRADADPRDGQAQDDLSASVGKLGDVTLQLGRPKDALDYYRKCNEILQRLADADPTNVRAQNDLSISFGRLGDVTLRLGQTTDALGHFTKANEIARKLTDADPTNAPAQHNLGLSFGRLGDVTLRLGRPADALGHFTKANEIAQKLADADPKDSRAQGELGLSFDRLGDVTLQLGQTKEALAHYTKANEVVQRRADADPTNTVVQGDLSVTFDKLGDVARQQGQWKEALSYYTTGRDIRQKLVDADPTDARGQTNLFVSYFKFGAVEKGRHNYAEAADWFGKARSVLLPLHEKKLLAGPFQNAVATMDREITSCRKAEKALADLDFALKQPAAEVPGLLDIRVHVFAKKSDLKNLLATAEAYEKLATADDKQIYNTACAWSLASGLARDDAKGKEEYAGKAMTLLRKTPTGKGQFVDSPAKLAAHMKADADLDPLRDRDEFKTLVADLEAKPPPKRELLPPPRLEK